MIDLSGTSSRLLLTVERMAVESSVSSTIEAAEGSNDGLSGTELIYILYPRISGLITVISAVCMMIMAWERQKFLFHRLVLGMSIHQLIYGLAYMLGTLAIPKEVGGHVGNYGTWGTCTAQGVLIYACVRGAMIYYASFCVYSYVGVLCGFDKKKYQWVEKYIHIFVNSYSIIMAVYLLFLQGFNPDHGFCKAASYPENCETSKEMVCERGPDDVGMGHILLNWILPMIVYLVVPTVTMGVLYFKVKRHEAKQDWDKMFFVKSRSIAIQSFVYLSTLYWTAIPIFIIWVLQYCMNSSSDTLFPYFLAAQINFSLFGLWSMLAYRHFSIEALKRRGKGNHKKERTTAVLVSLSLQAESTSLRVEDDKIQTNRRIDHAASEFIFDAGEQSLSSMAENSTDSPTTNIHVPTQMEDGLPEVEPSTGAEAKCQFSFNIFDGTNASGMFADFIYEGDSDDELGDREETQRWATAQDHV